VSDLPTTGHKTTKKTEFFLLVSHPRLKVRFWSHMLKSLHKHNSFESISVGYKKLPLESVSWRFTTGFERESKNHHPKNHSQHDSKTEKHSEKLHDIFGEIS